MPRSRVMLVIAAPVANFDDLAPGKRPPHGRKRRMRQGRWIAVAAGVAAAAALVAPAGAGVKSAASDKAILKAGLLTAGDVPSTWTSAKQTDPGTKGFQGITSCKQIVAATNAARRGPRALSRSFGDPSQTSNAGAQNTVSAFKNIQAAQQYLAAYTASSAATCFQDAFNRGTRGAQATVTPVTDLQGVGDQAVGHEASETGTDQSGKSVHVVADRIDVRVGRAVVTFMFGNSDVRIPQGVAIVQAVISRLTATVGG
jgi:hypothetical protein